MLLVKLELLVLTKEPFIIAENVLPILTLELLELLLPLSELFISIGNQTLIKADLRMVLIIILLYSDIKGDSPVDA